MGLVAWVPELVTCRTRGRGRSGLRSDQELVLDVPSNKVAVACSKEHVGILSQQYLAVPMTATWERSERH